LILILGVLLGLCYGNNEKVIWSLEGCQSVMPPPESLPVLKAMHEELRAKFTQVFRSLVADGENGIIFLWGGEVSSRTDSTTEEEFRQFSNFIYLTGVELPDFALAIDILNRQSILFAPKRDEYYALWNGEVLTLEQIQLIYGHDFVLYTEDIENTLMSISNNGERTIYLLPYQTLPNFPNVNNSILNTALGRSRIIKTPSEITLMRIAAKISSDAHVMLMKDSEVGLHEYNYGGYFEYYSASCGLNHHSYLPIVGSGNRSAILHYNTNRYQTINGDIILIDAGSEFRGYGTDITRTFPVNGRFSAEQTLIYEMVENIVTDIEGIIRPGIRASDMQARSTQLVCSALLQAGFLRGTLSELMANQMWYYFYPHGLGHSVGLDVHDPGFQGIYQENMVFTVEPGIYFNKAFMQLGFDDPIARNYLVADRIQSYLDMDFGGVRIEDTVIITSTGIENIALVPKSISEIEAIMNGP